MSIATGGPKYRIVYRTSLGQQAGAARTWGATLEALRTALLRPIHVERVASEARGTEGGE